jgi:tRNA 2-thiocytidine biosynthesis protein TtcA
MNVSDLATFSKRAYTIAHMLPICTDIPIAEPPFEAGGRRLESAVRKALYEYDLISGKKIAVALSGGKDSLTLLFLLKAISGRGFPPFDLHAIHVSGAFSCGPGMTLKYLENVCKKLKVPLTVAISSYAPQKLECYSCSRSRRGMLFNEAKKLGIDTIAFGHHRDDSIETLLLNLLHKGEFAANLPKVFMEDYGITIIRPLLLIGEKEIISFAKRYNYARIVCQCPVGQTSKRGEVKKILTELEAAFPNARENLALASRISGSDKAARK